VTAAVAAWLCGLALVVLGAVWLWVVRGPAAPERVGIAAL
jgi:hypothetical protein